MNRYSHNRHDRYNRNYWLVKIWLTFLIIITFIYIFSYALYDLDFDIPSDLRTLRSETPAYPPPLVNFMDPPNVFDSK